ncbi:MAG TPA: hypothetical protein VIP11_16305 [Gemmatimonadaceae bacterium]
MADVQIQQPGSSGGSSGFAWAIVVLVLLGIIAWFVFGGGLGGMKRESTTKIDVNVPNASSPAPSAPAPSAPAPNPPSGGGAPKP